MMPKVILITGASRGIGASLALTYASCGVTLFLVGRDKRALSDVAIHCRNKGAETHVAVADVSDKKAIQTVIEQFDALSPIELLIANAGATSMLTSGWKQESEDDIDAVISTNFLGAINTVKPMVDMMITRRRGQIAIVSSLLGFRGFPQSPSYCASKAGVKAYAESLRGWLRLYDIKVSVVCPGYVKTAMSDKINAPKPFMIEPDKAAKIIQKGLMRNKPCIAFPRLLTGLLRLSKLMHPDVFYGLMRRIQVK